jgi:hypothetical protein
MGLELPCRRVWPLNALVFVKFDKFDAFGPFRSMCRSSVEMCELSELSELSPGKGNWAAIGDSVVGKICVKCVISVIRGA